MEILQNDIFALPEIVAISPLIMYWNIPASVPLTQNAAPNTLMLWHVLLKPNGIYIDLAFPLDGRKGGPPFAVTRIGDHESVPGAWL